MKPLCRYFALWMALGGAVSAHAEGGPSANQLKAAFLFNFARLVTWPADAFSSSDTPFTICVLGDDDFGATVAEIVRGKQVADRPFAVETYAHVAEVTGCQILFVGTSHEEQLEAITSALRGSSIFSMADSPEFARLGGVGNFKVVDNKVRFEFNLAAARDGRLNISSRLLRLADLVE